MEKSSNKFDVLRQDDVDDKDEAEADIYELNKQAITTKINSLTSSNLRKCHQTDRIIKYFDVIPVEGDGNCFYYCLEEAAKLGLLGEDNINKTHTDFRQEAYTIIKDNPKYINFFVGSEKEQKAEINKIKEDKNWADNVEILALAEEYDLQFIILEMNGQETKIGDDENLNKIYLYFCNYTRGEVENHYELLIPKQFSTSTPPSTLTSTSKTITRTFLTPPVPIEAPKGTIQDYNEIEEQEDNQYFIYDLNIDDDEFYKIILKYPTKNKNILQQLKDLFTRILNDFLSSVDYIKNYIDKSEYYPELFTLLFGNYLKFIGDDEKMLSEFYISPEHNKEIISKCSNNLSEYVKNYLNWGFRLDNIKEINKRIFMNNLLDSIINPYNIRDNFSPERNNDNIKKLYQLKDEFMEDNKILPNKRETYFSTLAIKQDYKNNNLSFENYEKIYNYNLDEKININNGYTFIIDWIFKTFCKSYLEYYKINGEENNFVPTDFEKLNEYFDAQKNIKLNPPNYDELNQFLSTIPNKKYQQIFYNKWRDLLNYFGNFKKYYYDDKYYNEIVKNNKFQPLSCCLENFISNKVIPNDDNDDPSNFRYLFVYCLMTRYSREKLESIFPNISKKNIINISNIKWKFFNYLKYLQDLNQSNHNCKLEFESGNPIVNYCNYYFAKQLEFYGRLNLNFDECDIQSNSEIFYNYIIYLVMSEPVIYLCEKLNILYQTFADVVKSFISSQYDKIYKKKTINLYRINFTQSFADLYSRFLQVHTDEFKKLTDLVQMVEKSKPKYSGQIKFATGGDECVGCPDYNIGDTNEKYYINQINTIFGQPTYVEISKKDEKSTDIEDSELPPLANVLSVNTNDILNLNYKRRDKSGTYVLELTGKYDKTVIECIKKIINDSYKNNGFFDLINIIELAQLDNFIQIVKEFLEDMADYIQTKMYDKNPSKFECENFSLEFEDKILKKLDDDRIYKEIVGCFDGSTDNTIKISYRYFYQQEKGETIGNYIYKLIEKNKYLSDENSFLEIIKRKVLDNKESNVKDIHTFNDNFISFVNKVLNFLIGFYKDDESSFNYDKLIDDGKLYGKLIDDLSDLIVLRFNKLEPITEDTPIQKQGTKPIPPKEQTVSYAEALAPGIESKLKSTIDIPHTIIHINLDPETDKIDIGDKTLYQLIKSYLETCIEVVELSKYYYQAQIQSGIEGLINLYRDGHIPIDTNTFCEDFTYSILTLMTQQIIPPNKMINSINIKQEYFNLSLNKYINMGIIISNFISQSALFSRLDQKYLQDGFDYLYEIYSNEVDEIKEMTTKEGIDNKIYEDIKKYQYIRKCLDEFFSGDFFMSKIKPEYTEPNIKLIENGMVDILFKNEIINIPFGEKNIDIKIMQDIKKNRCPLGAEFTKLFGYIKSTQKIPKISEMSNIAPQTTQQTQVYPPPSKFVPPNEPISQISTPNITPSLTVPVKTTKHEKISWDNRQRKYIIPDKYSSYPIKPRPNSDDPQNLQQCLNIYLNDKLRKAITLNDYYPIDLINIINTMAEKLIKPENLPAQYENLRKQRCFYNELTSLFNLTRDEYWKKIIN